MRGLGGDRETPQMMAGTPMSDDTETTETEAPRAPSDRRRSEFAISLAVLAAVLAVVGIAVSGWLLMIELRGEPVVSSAQFETMTARMTEQISRLEDQLAIIEDAQRPDAEQQARIVSLDGRVDELMQRQAALAGFINSGAEINGLARAEALLAIAIDRAQLAGDLDVALAASQRALRQLETIGDDGLAPVVVTLADEIALLEQAAEDADRGAAAAALRAVQDAVARMPLRHRELGDTTTDPASQPEGAAWYQRLWSGLSRGLSGVFVIRHSDTELRPLLAPEESWFLRRNLELTLTGARLALVDGDSEAYLASITDASQWMRAYFDAEDQRVLQSLNTLDQVASVLSGDPASGIGRALELLRQYGTSETP
jgi:uroporphyrin-III C-methyltransferase